MRSAVTPLSISLPTGGSVSALLCARAQASAVFSRHRASGGACGRGAGSAAARRRAGAGFRRCPAHPAGKPGTQRAAHLAADVEVPMLFLQGTRDALADLPLMRATASQLGELATLPVVEGADHSFHVLVRSGRSDAQVLTELADAVTAWMSG